MWRTDHAPVEDDAYEKLRLELRRGSLVLAVLAALKDERYGYTLPMELADAGLPIDEGALYPMLRRLETQGRSDQPGWREEAPRNKRSHASCRPTARRCSPNSPTNGATSTPPSTHSFEGGQTMDLIDRYLDAVRVPLRGQRDDITAELRDDLLGAPPS